jgi:hypothetical protein
MVERERLSPKFDLQLLTPLLATEMKNEFDQLLAGFNDAVKPRDMIERTYTADITYITLEILRLRRYQESTIKASSRNALASALTGLLPEDQEFGQKLAKANDLAHGAFSDPASKRQVSELLNQNQLDESAIEAEGISNSFEKLERIMRLLTTLESRRDRALRQIFEYRNGFAQRLRDTSDRIIEGKAVAVDDNAGKSR